MTDPVNWAELTRIEARKIEAGDPPSRFRAFALKLLGAPYLWGAEGPEGTDCSGTVCFSLWMMGHNIRVTADVLYRELFIKPAKEYLEDEIQAVFYVATKNQVYGPGKVLKVGQARHVTPLVGRNVVLNAGEHVTLETAAYICQWFETRDCTAVWRTMDPQAASRMSKSLDYAWDADPVLTVIRRLGGVG